ncbi:hypothetical protein BDY21DRAFT_402319 [Lineolata rhizophorae]|uniref:Gfo/Idh/MocA-like oxidoreductase N-terminal domain-containing protein n=1 Tax=Lineolata rhizophorae TaxID=578093 RepID=A0A6A6NP67_9PEZI|nr:hypothetical protein BDY21DRAFT_402319 [Lineolata rhizophorae]
MPSASNTATPSPINIAIIGAGSRGSAYASALSSHPRARVIAVCDPHAGKRAALGGAHIWGARDGSGPREGEAFADWREWVAWERGRRARAEGAAPKGVEVAGGREGGEGAEVVPPGADAVVVAVLDELHVEVVEGVSGLGGVHVLCEKPVDGSWEGCGRVWRALTSGPKGQDVLFGVCHVLRYSPHNRMLRELVLGRDAVGEVLSVEHTEPVGWWHFSHSYVRGNWRREASTAPTLLTKSCHDIDFLMWMLCSPPPGSDRPPHLPAYVTSTGSLKFFKKSRKPADAGDATNCLSCPIEHGCMWSAKKIYLERHLLKGITGWPVKIVEPDVEDIFRDQGRDAAMKHVLGKLREDYGDETAETERYGRPWFGRCVWEADNDVCDDQTVTITWEDDPLPNSDRSLADALKGRGAKTATMHMVAFTEKICERRGVIYGTEGEISYDSATIKVHNFATGETEIHHPAQPGGGHGGGDAGLIYQFVAAVDAVKNQGMSIDEAQKVHIGCTLEEAIRSHGVVFAAEEARRQRRVVEWASWWRDHVGLL